MTRRRPSPSRCWLPQPGSARSAGCLSRTRDSGRGRGACAVLERAAVRRLRARRQRRWRRDHAEPVPCSPRARSSWRACSSSDFPRLPGPRRAGGSRRRAGHGDLVGDALRGAAERVARRPPGLDVRPAGAVCGGAAGPSRRRSWPRAGPPRLRPAVHAPTACLRHRRHIGPVADAGGRGRPSNAGRSMALASATTFLAQSIASGAGAVVLTH